MLTVIMTVTYDSKIESSSLVQNKVVIILNFKVQSQRGHWIWFLSNCFDFQLLWIYEMKSLSECVGFNGFMNGIPVISRSVLGGGKTRLCRSKTFQATHLLGHLINIMNPYIVALILPSV